MSSLPISSVFNDGYVAEQYERFRRDPASLDESWRQFFRFAESLTGTPDGSVSSDPELLRKVVAAVSLVESIRRSGHLAVELDPLGAPPPGGSAPGVDRIVLRPAALGQRLARRGRAEP